MSQNLFTNNSSSRQIGPLFPPTSPQQPPTNPSSQQPLLNPPSTSNARPTQPSQATTQQTTQQKVPQQSPSLLGRRRERAIKFKQIYKQIQQYPEQAMKKIEANVEIRRILSVSLEYFDRSAEKTQLYEREHSKKDNFGFGVEEMREECRNMKSQKIDYFWKVLVETVSEVCNVNQVLIAQYLSQYLRDEPIYPKKLSIRQFCNGRYIFSPNTNFIDTLYLLSSQQNQKKVCLQSQFFLQLFEYLATEVYSEYMAMLRIIEYLQTNNKRFFRQVIKKQTCDFYSVMWKKYQYFCQAGMKKELVGEDARKIRVKEFFANCKRFGIQARLRKQKVTLALYISVVLAGVLEQYGNWKRMPIISSLIDPNQAIKFVDEDLQALVRQRAENPVRQYQYIKFSLQLLLKILPICSLSKKVQPRPINMQQREIQQLRTSINSTKSPYLQPFRFLAWFTTPARRRPVSSTSNLLTQIQERWQRVPKSIQLIMRTQHWGEWVALLLDSCDNAEDIEGCEVLMQQIVKILKIYIEDNIQNFWTQGAFYQFEFIKNFLLAWIHEKGVHPFLPVLTKCLGQESKRLEFARKTLELIGFDGIKKQIRDSLMQNLDLSDKHNPSLKFSMFYSYNNTSRNTSFLQSQPSHNPRQSYPEQQLKFLCKLIQNSKQNLSLIQSTIFECQPEYSTGILVCKFLLQCLSKLRQYKISSIKCMRYVMKTIDALFQCQGTRVAMLVAISVCFMEEWGENNRGQLFQMIGFVCLKPSASQEFRQCQKLRKIISRHIYNITKVSRYMSEYFPLKQDIHQQSQFIQLNTLIMQKNHSAMLDWFNRNSIRLQLRATPWFISLILTLQAPQLLPTDFQTLRLLILKMPVEKVWVQEFGCQLAVLDVLNKSQIVEVVLSILEPSMSHTKSQITKQHIFLFSLTNLKYKQLLQLHLSSKQTGTLYNENECYFKIKQKQKKLFKSTRDIVIGNIAGTLELIATVLDLRARIDGGDGVGDCWDILRNLRLFNQICMFVVEKNSIYHYKVPLPRTITVPTTLQTPTSLQPQQPQQPQQPSYISINMLQVLTSYTNFESRHNMAITSHSNKPQPQQITTRSPQLLHNHDLTLIQYSAIKNCLNLDQNQLTFKSDFTIGIGTIFRILSRIVVRDTGALMLYRCLVYYDYRGLLEMGNWGSADLRQFGVFVREIVAMLEWVQESEQVESIFQFLTLAISNSSYFVQELVQSGLLPRLRRNINNIIQECDDEKRLNQYNKVGLFALALSEYRDRYREQIESFIKLPTNLIQDMLQCLSNLQPKYSRNQRQSTASPKQKQLAPNIEIYLKQAFCILFKGTLHLSIQLLKLYTPSQSTNQIISCIQVLRRLSTTFLTKPPKPDYNYATLFKQRSRNCFVLFDTNNPDVCVVVGEAEVKWKGRYKGLAKFVGFIPGLGWQYGYNYQFYGAQVFAKSIYAKFQVKDQAEALVLSVYRCNYQSSLVDCHQLMLMSFLSYVLMIQTTGQLGHLLSFASSDRILYSTQLPTSYPYLSPSPTSATPTPLLSQLKHHSRHNLQGPNLFSHTLHQNFSQKSTLLLSLISYFESDHQKQYINDLLLYTITMMLYNIQEYGVLGNQYENKILRLNNFVYDATRVRFACSGGVYATFLAVVLKGLIKRGVEGGYERVQEICQCLQSIITYGTAFSTLPQSPYPQKQPFTQKTIQQHLNLLSLCLTHVFKSSSPHSHPNRRSSITICIRIAGLIIERYLSFASQRNTNNIIICQVTNVMLRNCLAELKGNQEEWDDRRSRVVNGQDDTGLSQIAGMYAGRLIKGLVLGVDCCSKCFILQGLMIAHEYGVDNDVGCCNIVMEYMSSQFSNQQKKTEEIQNYPEPNISRTQQKFRPNTQYQLSQFPQDMWSSIRSVFTPNLQKIVEINQMLSLLNSIVSYSLYWTNQKYSHIVESIFNCMINQNFLTQILQVYPNGTSNRLLECRVPAQSSWQQILQKVQIEQNQPLRFQQSDFQYRYGDSFRDKKNESKKTNLFQFTIHLQICNSIYYYCQVLSECLQKSQNLKKFYSKILNSRLNNIDQQLWFKIQNTLTSSLIFLRQRCISFIRFYPKSLKKIVPIYNYIRKCPDIGYSSCFLNTLLCSANLTPNNMIESYRNFITDACLSICRCSIKLVQTWRSNDWKQSNSAIEGDNKIRDKLINQMVKFYRQWSSYVAVNEYIQEEQENMIEIQKWFESNNKFGK